MGNLIIRPLQVTEMLQIEDDNVRTDWKKAEKHTKFQDSKLKKVVQSGVRNKPITKQSLVHLFEAFQHVDHDQQLGDGRNLQSILNFGFMSNISNYFKKISLFSLTIYDVTNRRFLRLLCKPAVLAHTVFIDDDLEVHSLTEILNYFTNDQSRILIVLFSVRFVNKNTGSWIDATRGSSNRYYLRFLNVKSTSICSDIEVILDY